MLVNFSPAKWSRPALNRLKCGPDVNRAWTTAAARQCLATLRAGRLQVADAVAHRLDDHQQRGQRSNGMDTAPRRRNA
jgi:hypothetical protein